MADSENLHVGSGLRGGVTERPAFQPERPRCVRWAAGAVADPSAPVGELAVAIFVLFLSTEEGAEVAHGATVPVRCTQACGGVSCEAACWLSLPEDPEERMVPLPLEPDQDIIPLSNCLVIE